MTPDERQLLSGLFDRIHGAASQPRDHEAEAFIADAVRNQPYAPYLLSQTVIVQDQALRAANERLQQLEAQVKQQGAQPAEQTSFLGSIGKSIFGSGQSGAQQPSGQPVPSPWGAGSAGVPQQPAAYAPQQGTQGGPWGQQAGGGVFGGGAPAQGGGFLKGALGAAAGVAGGVLLADSISGLFGGHNNPFGIASGGMGGGFGGAPGGETIVNNYYDGNSGPGGDSPDPGSFDTPQDSADFSGDSFDSGSGDDSYNV